MTVAIFFPFFMMVEVSILRRRSKEKVSIAPLNNSKVHCICTLLMHDVLRRCFSAFFL